MKKIVLLTAFALYSLSALSQGFAHREAFYREILRQMTPEEKAYLLMGDGGVPRLGVPEFGMDDGARGPHTWDGSTGFPCGLGQSSAWNPELMFRYCSKCSGAHEYCQDHLFTHEHVKG